MKKKLTRNEIFSNQRELNHLLYKLRRGDGNEEDLQEVHAILNTFYGRSREDKKGFDRTRKLVDIFERNKNFNVEYIINEMLWGKGGLIDTYIEIK